MEHIAHQCIVMQFILELSKTLKCDPRACVGPFFTKMQTTNQEYKEGFFEELSSFKERIRRRAKEKLEAAMKEAEEEERQKRLGPGGLDPVEIFESLPDDLKKCFETQDIQLLQDTILKMKKEDAEYHMDRCVKSGLWVPDARSGVSENMDENLVNEKTSKNDDNENNTEINKIQIN
jgi:cell division cycle protein 37